jgi:hypothetical protein
VQRLHDSGNHSAVVETLLQTFTQSSVHRRSKDAGAPERHAQLLLLQDSLFKLADYRVRFSKPFSLSTLLHKIFPEMLVVG